MQYHDMKDFAVGEAYCKCKLIGACPNRAGGNEHKGRFVSVVSRIDMRRLVKQAIQRRGDRSMKIVSLRLTTTAVFALAFAVTGRAADRDEGGDSKNGFQAKLEYCKTCHGLSGEGYRGYFPMPRLAGQQPKYIENQLRAFIERRRVNPVMFNVAHVLSPATLAALSAHFRELESRPHRRSRQRSHRLGKDHLRTGISRVQCARVFRLSRS